MTTWIDVDRLAEDLIATENNPERISWIVIPDIFEGNAEQFLDCLGLEFNGPVTEAAVKAVAEGFGKVAAISYETKVQS